MCIYYKTMGVSLECDGIDNETVVRVVLPSHLSFIPGVCVCVWSFHHLHSLCLSGFSFVYFIDCMNATDNKCTGNKVTKQNIT